MRQLSRFVTTGVLFVSATLLAANVASSLLAAAPEPVVIGDVVVYRLESDKEATIRTALDKPHAIPDKPVDLPKLLIELETRYAIPYHLEANLLSDYGIDPKDVTFAPAPPTRLRTLLDETLSKHGLVWTIEDDSLYVTVEDQAPYRHRQRIYDITDLAEPEDAPEVTAVYRDRHEALTEVIERSIMPDSWERMGGLGSMGLLRMRGRTLLVISQSEKTFERLDLFFASLRKIVPRDPAGTPATVAAKSDALVTRVFPLNDLAGEDDLTETVREFVAPETWTEEGVKIRRAAGTLVIRHRPAVQAQVRAMLGSMNVLQESPNGAPGGADAIEDEGDVIPFGGGLQIAPNPALR